jgi:hypothetical protein
MENFESEVNYGDYAIEPASAVINGEWLVVSVTKFWFQHEKRVGNDAEKGGLTFEYPFGNEIRLALPLNENPTTEIPENCITVQQLKIALKSAISTVKGDN